MTKPTRNFVVEKLREVFPNRDTAEVLAILDGYGREGCEKEVNRVHLAILKLCEEENQDDPTHYVEVAKSDYRDVLAWAEYPNQMRQPGNMDAEKRAALKKRDAKQYRKWLDKRG